MIIKMISKLYSNLDGFFAADEKTSREMLVIK